ncbi:S8 family serine peptidase [Echinicola soli]|uniref:Serine protease n=1 Tax=Echinicola soli TaxID=2591634 RepID=A0A514CKD8_9BACT|nr:S8 family serine peptidase [Echinicola soli]QDH80272.1 S8 family serine peptidase [Echinicola soli]
MVTRWSLMEYVADRYGKVQPVFEEAAKKLLKVKAKEIPLLSLEDDLERVKLRMAREEGEMPIIMERINGGVDFQDSYILEMLSALSKAVCRITQHGRPLGTGFLISDNVIITNNHVIDSSESAHGMLAEFNYELDRDKNIKKSFSFQLDAERFFLTSSYVAAPEIPYSGLDFTMIAVAEKSQEDISLSTIKPIYLDGIRGKIIKGESCVIIQHPKGMPKKIVLKNTAFFSETRTRIVYESDTLPGSSGSMVVALGTGEIIALHHAGLPRTDSQNRILTRSGEIATASTPDEEIDWIGNEGIKISRVINALTNAELPAEMQEIKRKLLHKTEMSHGEINTENKHKEAVFKKSPIPLPSKDQKPKQTMKLSTQERQDYIFTARNNPKVLRSISDILGARYGEEPVIKLSMPAFAAADNVELFTLNVPVLGNTEDEARNLSTIPGIINVETDIPLHLNTGNDQGDPVRSKYEGIVEDGYGKPNECEFLKKYRDERQSVYVLDKSPQYHRKWNWFATSFDKVLADKKVISPKDQGIKIVQFDTGFTTHAKVDGGFDKELDMDFVDRDDDAADSFTAGILKHPGHATRTGSLLIGNEVTLIDENGNSGLLAQFDFKLIPYRICKSVILIRRQQELADALNLCIAQRYPIISMSLGLPPTMATAAMAKKAYDAGIIWCCAAGNAVQVVVAPAVYPGTIAVAASNPMDEEWKGSSRGSTVDITAPGEDVYVPIFLEPKNNQKPEESFSYGNGTSYATPHVAAAAALWLAKYEDVLSNGSYTGWKKVEAFRKAMDVSARRKNRLPKVGFGHGILDVEKLLKTSPEKPDKLEYAYENTDEGRLGEVTQAYGEMAKTLWNRIHGWAFGIPRGGQESNSPGQEELSDYSKMLERTLVTSSTSGALESTGDLSQKDLLELFSNVHQKIESELKK